MDKLRVEHDEEIDTHKITDAIEANLGLLVEFQFLFNFWNIMFYITWNNIDAPPFGKSAIKLT